VSVLVVEDHADTADSLAVLLRHDGHGVHIARTGAEALAVYREILPDVIVLDIAIPGMDGWEVARQIRHIPSKTVPLLLVVSGYGQDADKRRSAEAGIDLHLTKPVDPDTLMSLMGRFRRDTDPPKASAELRTAETPVDFGLRAARVDGRMHHFREYARKISSKTRRTTELTERIERLCHRIRQG
jgi:CheY-like chemotaxis protein